MDIINLRKKIISQRAALSDQKVIDCSSMVCQSIEHTKQYQEAENIAFYYSIRGEICLTKLWENALTQGKKCFFPICVGNMMHFVPATPQTAFIKNKLGVLEPKVDISAAIDINALELVLTPLVAFDAFGMRLGMGKGFYDKAFSFLADTTKVKPILFGIAYEFQRQDKINKQPWDILLDAIYTENQSYDCHAHRSEHSK